MRVWSRPSCGGTASARDGAHDEGFAALLLDPSTEMCALEHTCAKPEKPDS